MIVATHHYLVLVLLLSAGTASATALLVLLRARASARYLTAHQHRLVSAEEVLSLRETISAEQRPLFDTLIRLVKEQHQFVRFGHALWAIKVVLEDAPSIPIPSFQRVADTPYRLLDDPGLPYIPNYIAMKAADRNADAYEYLWRGVELGSPFCMNAFGVSLLRGDVSAPPPHIDPVQLIRRAVHEGAPALDLADLLLAGEHVARDVPAALDLLRKESASGKHHASFQLARIYLEGLHGVAPDTDLGTRWGLCAAPLWVRALHAAGLNQTAWVVRMVDLRQRLADEIEKVPPSEIKARLRSRLSDNKP